MTVVQYEEPPPLPPSRQGDELVEGPTGDVARLRAAAEYASYIGDTEFVPETLRGRNAAITAALLAGDELGLKKMVALRTIAIIKGRPTLTAEAQRGLVTANGHELWFEESTVTRAIAAGRRSGSERVGRVTWTIDDAKRAGIAGQQNWQRYPAEMLRARASAALARAMFADVTLGIPASEELEGEPDNGVVAVSAPLELPEPPTDPSPAPRRQTRRRPAATPPPPTTGPAPAKTTREPLPPTPPADTQPEPPAPDEPLATDAMKRRVFASMRDLGLSDRDERLAYTTAVVDRQIASSNDLTIGEASRLIERLDADKAARLAGEQAFIDELRTTLDATDEPGAAVSAPVAEAAPAEQPADPEPEPPETSSGEPPPAQTGPVTYNEFPDGF